MTRMIEQNTVVDLLNRATTEVLSTMLGIEAIAGPSFVEARTASKFEGVVSFIGMAGDWVGTGSIHCRPEAACMLASRFMMSDYTTVNDEVLDAMGELTNMILGNFKNDVELHTGPMGLSIPTVIHGKNFSARSLGNEEWTVAPFDFEGNSMNLRICLKPNENVSRQHRGAERQQFVLQS